ncbi:MAG: anthranilate phosphoribosyltransferase [Acidiferrobacter sp.]
MQHSGTKQPLGTDKTAMSAFIGRIATGPELSKDLSREEARQAMRLILEGAVDPVQAGVFLIALRMKRETDDENLGVLDAVRDATRGISAAVDEVVDIADPYDGYTRSLPSSPFLPAVLAACGVAAVSHGLERVGPKYGITHRQILRAAGVRVDLTPTEAAARLADPAIGWAYLDQKAFCPRLHALVPLRDLIVKRPVLTTVETLIGPVRGRHKTHLVTGYVHKPYPRVYALLARQAGLDSALIVRGIEGGVTPSLRQTGAFVYYHDRGEEQTIEIHPSELGIVYDIRATPMPGYAAGHDDMRPLDHVAMAQAAADAGERALAGAPGPTRDGLVYSAAMCLWHLHRCDSPQSGAAAVRAVLDGGQARAHLGQG